MKMYFAPQLWKDKSLPTRVFVRKELRHGSADIFEWQAVRHLIGPIWVRAWTKRWPGRPFRDHIINFYPVTAKEANVRS
jgi:hypothetical protein